VWSKTDFRLSEVKGQPIVIHFWATWCGPCLQELPEIIAVAKAYRLKGYTFVAVAIDRDWATLESFFQRYPALRELTNAMVVVLDPDSRIAEQFGSSRFPETVLINDQMVMDNKFIGAQPWQDPRMARFLDTLRTP
jgi:thiol-disulfide isomerase/thioredoxin